MTKGHFIRLALFVVMTGHFISAGGLRADELRAKLEAKLVEIKRDLFDTRGVASVAVGEFSGAANLKASGGPAISNALIDAFQKNADFRGGVTCLIDTQLGLIEFICTS